jgi:predicted dienelactone hydrolase
MLFNGARWQLFPAYFLSVTLLLLNKNTGKTVKYLISTAFCFSFVLPNIVPIISFPDPEGPHETGSLIHHWVDEDREEWFTPENNNDKRQFMVQIWYPGINQEKSKALPFLDNLNTRAKTIAAAGSFPSFLAMHLDLIKTNSSLNIQPDPTAGPMPILIISHGITGMRQLHTSLAERFASNGYAVFALDHTYDANISVFPDGLVADYRSEITGDPDSVNIRRRQINTRVSDLRFIIDQLEQIQSGSMRHPLNGYLDLDRIGITGHSFGGSTAALTGNNDKRVKAVSVIDGWMNPLPDDLIREGIDLPYLYMGRPSWTDSDYPSSPSLSEDLHQNNTGPSHHIIIRETRHLNFCDAPLFTPIGKYLVEIGDINRKRSVELVNQLSLEFFDKYLRQKPSSLLSGSVVIPEFIVKSKPR